MRGKLTDVSCGLLSHVVASCVGATVALNAIDVGDSVCMRCKGRAPLKVDLGFSHGIATQEISS